jgi:hypothetical protein
MVLFRSLNERFFGEETKEQAMSTGSTARQRAHASGRLWCWRAALVQSTIDHGDIR